MAKNQISIVRNQLKQQYELFLNKWPGDDNINEDSYVNKYNSLCKELAKSSEDQVNEDICKTFFGFLENINLSGHDIYKNHSRWTNFINWSYKKINNNGSNNLNLENIREFMIKFGRIFHKKINGHIDNVEILNNDNEILKNVLKLHYFSNSLGDFLEELKNGYETDPKYKSYCQYTNDCLDIYDIYYPALCSTDITDEEIPEHVCEVINKFKKNYDDRVFPEISYRGNTIKVDGLVGSRVKCSVLQTQYKDSGFVRKLVRGFVNNVKAEGFSPFMVTMIIGYSLLGILLIFFILYKCVISSCDSSSCDSSSCDSSSCDSSSCDSSSCDSSSCNSRSCGCNYNLKYGNSESEYEDEEFSDDEDALEVGHSTKIQLSNDELLYYGKRCRGYLKEGLGCYRMLRLRVYSII
ncbi:PIR protein [Plasmodium brasilianum]|uniref:PIR protein n=1 Tax=Plasmodium brasilianum TaxID=5824 RepID=A0ACB9YG35_PLABR|nr:PIR protein [Plasmodium brasilianum]